MKTLDRIKIPTEAPFFNELKVAEAGVTLIKLSGGRQSLVKLLAMLFLVDRRLIERQGVGLTDDEYFAHEGEVAVPLGIFDHAGRRTLFTSIWHRHIECHSDWSVKVLSEMEQLEMSATEQEIVISVGKDYARLDDESFIDALKLEAPEVSKLGTAHFTLRDVLVSLGDDPEEAEAAYQDWASLRRVRYGSNLVGA